MRRLWLLLPVLAWLTWSPTTTDPQVPGGHRVVVFDHGWHSGIVVTRDSLQSVAGPVGQGWLRDFPDASWFELGWGDRGFYFDVPSYDAVTVSIAAKALLWPSESVLHVATGQGDPVRVFAWSTPVVLLLDDTSLQSLVRALEAGSGGQTALGPGLYGTSLFYPGRGRYHLFKTCNSWVAASLRQAGVGASRLLSTHAAPMVWELKWRHFDGVR